MYIFIYEFLYKEIIYMNLYIIYIIICIEIKTND